MQLILYLLLFVSCSAWAKVKSELSGNIEGQMRHSWNNPEAKGGNLQQNWDEEDFYLAYGNINGKLDFNGSRLEANWFTRYSQSDLYDPPKFMGQDVPPYLATKIFTFPNKLVARDLFRMQYEKQNGNSNLESVINKLYYEWDYGEHRFMVGRLYVNYGLGEIFNPVNPFNQPTGLTSISQVAQGNDGLSFTFFASDVHTVQFLLLGDKGLEEGQSKIDRTVWAHGEYQWSDDIQLDYVLGEDQRRQKIGGQFMWKLEEAMIFTQALYQTRYVNGDPSDYLWDLLLGYDQQLTNLWHIRFEGGYQKRDQKIATINAFGDRFLPSEYFLALANVYEVHPLVRVNLTVANDIKSGFTYLITKINYDLGHDMEAELFGYIPAAKGDAIENDAQKLVTTDIGLALRAFF